MSEPTYHHAREEDEPRVCSCVREYAARGSGDRFDEQREIAPCRECNGTGRLGLWDECEGCDACSPLTPGLHSGIRFCDGSGYVPRRGPIKVWQVPDLGWHWSVGVKACIDYIRPDGHCHLRTHAEALTAAREAMRDE